MLKFFDQHVLWPNIKQAIKRFRGKNRVGVAYLGKAASQLLPLGRGDVLVCALSERAAKAGLVCPDEIGKFQRRGVEVYIGVDLHAKIYLAGDRVFVSSANVSQSSESTLDEAGLLTNDPVVLGKVYKWFDDRMLEPVTPEWLAHCASIYRPPRAGPPQKNVRSLAARASSRRIWLLGVREIDFPESEKAICEAAEREAKKDIQNRRKFEVRSTRCTGSSPFLEVVNPGDLIIEVRDDSEVSGHARLLKKRSGKTARGAKVTYLALECFKESRTMSWAQFKKGCGAVGLNLGKTVTARQITDVFHQNRVLFLTSHERLRE